MTTELQIWELFNLGLTPNGIFTLSMALMTWSKKA